MLFGWPEDSEEKKILINQTQEFCKSLIKPQAKRLDETGEFPAEIIKKLASLGLLGMMVPEQWGGSGLDTVSYAMVIEQIAIQCASTAVILSVNNSLVCYPIDAYGTDKQKTEFLIPLAKGKHLGCFALSEPGHGSDPAGLVCQATPVSGGYKIKGIKNWITNGKEADICIVFATMDRALKSKGICAFIVDTN